MPPLSAESLSLPPSSMLMQSNPQPVPHVGIDADRSRAQEVHGVRSVSLLAGRMGDTPYGSPVECRDPFIVENAHVVYGSAGDRAQEVRADPSEPSEIECHINIIAGVHAQEVRRHPALSSPPPDPAGQHAREVCAGSPLCTPECCMSVATGVPAQGVRRDPVVFTTPSNPAEHHACNVHAGLALCTMSECGCCVSVDVGVRARESRHDLAPSLAPTGHYAHEVCGGGAPFSPSESEDCVNATPGDHAQEVHCDPVLACLPSPLSTSVLSGRAREVHVIPSPPGARNLIIHTYQLIVRSMRAIDDTPVYADYTRPMVPPSPSAGLSLRTTPYKRLAEFDALDFSTPVKKPATTVKITLRKR
ncbi:hypothetical protein BOTBODRAFT_178844 [Botryobasidium botryosum FD-172 SS1]|uniref:Uncharacterized protein n=1 Tax=Botryobasidium botryosum (strain FD-172 SS1) TaxID=930990 RepID=A0A067M4I0_BOTB1|nr:hypothetical protein BOTBODRAFT_178844 [Botryobasidium botryosum FD-172 SS1]